MKNHNYFTEKYPNNEKPLLLMRVKRLLNKKRSQWKSVDKIPSSVSCLSLRCAFVLCSSAKAFINSEALN